MGPELAFAASARSWPDRLHRHVLDHGGAVIATTAMTADQALAADCAVLLIDDVCSFLNPRLVDSLRAGGCEVVGVFDPSDGSDAKRRLLDCGISNVIEENATPVEFLEMALSSVTHRPTVASSEGPGDSHGLVIGVAGAAQGVGVTEVAAGLSGKLSTDLASLLIDLDADSPSVAQRLDLSLHPNIRTTLDRVLHGGDIGSSFQRCDHLDVIGGTADRGASSPLTTSDVTALLDALVGSFEILVVDLGPLKQSSGSAVLRCDTLVIVGTGDPVGLSRLLASLEHVENSARDIPVLALVNRSPRGRFYRSEIKAEIARSHPAIPVITVAADSRVEASAWEGTTPKSGVFAKAIGEMAEVVRRSVG